MMPLSKLLFRYKDPIDIQEVETYKRITIRMNNQGIVMRDCILGSQIGTKKQFIAKSGQLVLSKIDARNSAFGILPKECDGAIITGNFWAFDVNSKFLDTKYFNYLTHTPVFVDFCIKASDGTTNRRYLDESKFLSMQIPLPPLGEQRRIVVQIEELAAKVEEARGLRRQSVNEAEVLWASSAQKLVFELANKNLQPLGDLVTVRGGGTPSKSNPFFWNGSIPWVCPKDMKSLDIKDSIDHISEEATYCSSAKLIEPGCVLIVVRGMILDHTVPSAILRVPAAINQDMKALVPNKSILSEYLCKILWAMNHLLHELVQKSTHDTRKLETPKLLNFKIPVPPVPEQHRIVAYLDNLQAKVDTLKRLQTETAAELDALLPSILDKAFKGEL